MPDGVDSYISSHGARSGPNRFGATVEALRHAANAVQLFGWLAEKSQGNHTFR